MAPQGDIGHHQRLGKLIRQHHSGSKNHIKNKLHRYFLRKKQNHFIMAR